MRVHVDDCPRLSAIGIPVTRYARHEIIESSAG